MAQGYIVANRPGADLYPWFCPLLPPRPWETLLAALSLSKMRVLVLTRQERLTKRSRVSTGPSEVPRRCIHSLPETPCSLTVRERCEGSWRSSSRLEWFLTQR